MLARETLWVRIVTSSVPVTIQIPLEDYLVISALAEGAGVDTIAEFLMKDLQKHTTGTKADIVRLHAQGYTDREIAVELKQLLVNVQQHRLKCGLFANKPRKRQ